MNDRILAVKLIVGAALFGFAADFVFYIFFLIHAHFETVRLAASLIPG